MSGIVSRHQFNDHSVRINNLEDVVQFHDPLVRRLDAFRTNAVSRLDSLEASRTTTDAKLKELDRFEKRVTPQISALEDFKGIATSGLTEFDAFRQSASTKLNNLEVFQKATEPILKGLDAFKKNAIPRLEKLELAEGRYDGRLKELENLRAGDRLKGLETFQTNTNTRLGALEKFQSTSDQVQDKLISAVNNITVRIEKTDQILEGVPGLKTRFTDLEKGVKDLAKKVDGKVDKKDLPTLVEETTKGKPDEGGRSGGNQATRGRDSSNILVKNYGQLQVQHSPNCNRIGDSYRGSFNSHCPCMDSHNTNQFPLLPGPGLYGSGGFLPGLFPIYPPRSPSPEGYRRGHRTHRSRGGHSEQAAYAGAVMPSVHLEIESQGKGGLFSGSKKNNFSFDLGGGGAAGYARNARSYRSSRF